jgi:hypothetical protein
MAVRLQLLLGLRARHDRHDATIADGDTMLRQNGMLVRLHGDDPARMNEGVDGFHVAYPEIMIQ